MLLFVNPCLPLCAYVCGASTPLSAWQTAGPKTDSATPAAFFLEGEIKEEAEATEEEEAGNKAETETWSKEYEGTHVKQEINAFRESRDECTNHMLEFDVPKPALPLLPVGQAQNPNNDSPHTAPRGGRRRRTTQATRRRHYAPRIPDSPSMDAKRDNPFKDIARGLCFEYCCLYCETCQW